MPACVSEFLLWSWQVRQADVHVASGPRVCSSVGAELCKCTEQTRPSVSCSEPLQISKFGGDPDRVTIWGQSAGELHFVVSFVKDHGLTLRFMR